MIVLFSFSLGLWPFLFYVSGFFFWPLWPSSLCRRQWRKNEKRRHCLRARIMDVKETEREGKRERGDCFEINGKEREREMVVKLAPFHIGAIHSQYLRTLLIDLILCAEENAPKKENKRILWRNVLLGTNIFKRPVLGPKSTWGPNVPVWKFTVAKSIPRLKSPLAMA